MEEFNIHSSKEDSPNNLIFISEHSDQHIFNCLSTRLSKGQNYTFAGPVLISTTTEAPSTTFSHKQRQSYSDTDTEEPHLYSTSLKVYTQLKSTYQNQVITLLGYSGAGKTFAAIHLIDHLCYLSSGESSFPLLHASLQVLHVMGSVFSAENGESSACGIISSLLYDQSFNLVKGQFKAKLLDYSLPYSPNGNTYHVLHALVTTTKTQLQSLGLSSIPSFKIFGNKPMSTKEILYHGHNFDRFYRNLQILKFTRAEIQEVLEMFSIVILLFEINFVGNQFVVAGDKEYTEWTPRHRTAVQKVCKLLLVSEDKFLELFQGIQHKSLVDCKIRELARSVYLVAFEWVLSKINAKLNQFSLEELKKKGVKKEDGKFLPTYQVSVVDFPGFHNNSSLGGFCSNLSLECLNLFAADKLVGLLNSLQSEKISMSILPEPISRDLVTILMSKEFGLLQSLDIDSFDKYWKEFRAVTKSNKQITTTNVSVLVKYAWGEVEYDINQLRSEARRFIHPSEFSQFFSRCSNNLVKKVITPNGLTLSESFRKDLSILLEPLVGYENSLIFFLKSEKGKIDYGDTIKLLRNTLIMTCLYWEWYGYQHWVSNSKLLKDLGVCECSPGQTHTFITSLLTEILPADEFVVGVHFTLFKDRAFQMFSQKSTDLKFDQGSRTNATFEAFSPTNRLKKVRAQSSKFLSVNPTAFYYNCYGEPPVINTGIYDFLDSVADISDMSFKKESLSRLSKTSSNCSIASSKDTLQTVRSQKHFKTLKNSLSNYKILNYSEQLPEIINIQRCWRGCMARKYFRVFLLLKNSACKIQAMWKMHKAHKFFKDAQKSAKFIQKVYKKRFRDKNRAASLIQTWYRQLKFTNNNIEDISSQVSSIENTSIPLLNPSQRSATKFSQLQQPSETFKPQILNHSRNLAKIRESKMGNANMPVEKRLEYLYLLKKSKIEDLRKNKVDEERVLIKPSPSINKSQEFSSNFLQRQEIKTQQIRMRREKEVVKKQCEELANYTFKPTLISKSSKSLERSVKDLQVWAEVKKFQVSKAQKVKADEEARSVSPFRMSINSKKILYGRQQKLAERNKAANEFKDSFLPYWPNKSSITE